MKCFPVICLLAALPLLGAGLVWDFTRPQPDWGRPRNLKTRLTEEGLELTVTGPDTPTERECKIIVMQFIIVVLCYRKKGKAAQG